jgi:hypothetical protein
MVAFLYLFTSVRKKDLLTVLPLRSGAVVLHW